MPQTEEPEGKVSRGVICSCSPLLARKIMVFVTRKLKRNEIQDGSPCVLSINLQAGVLCKSRVTKMNDLLDASASLH